jgi:hypothetical protein
MKKLKILLLFICLTVIQPKAQSQSYYNTFAFNFGPVQDGFGGLLSYDYFLDRHNFIEASLFLTAANYKYQPKNDSEIKIPYNDFTANVGYSHNVFTNYKNTYNLNISGGGVFGYETLNKGENILSNGASLNSRPGFIYGAYLGIELDISLTDATSVIIRGNEFYHANSSLGQFIPFGGLGLRFYLE